MAPGGSVSQSAKKHDMYTASAWLFLVTMLLVGWAVLSLHDKDTRAAIVATAWALIFASPIPLFIWPSTCGYTNTRGRPCPEPSYGFLLGCRRYYHWWPKLLVRIRLLKEAQRQVERHQQTRDTAIPQSASGDSVPLVRVADSPLSLCGAWAGIISAATGVIALIIH